MRASLSRDMARLSLFMFQVALCLSCCSSAASVCHCIPPAPCWPSASTWEAFNSSVQGKLVSVRPPAAPCHDPSYDEGTCKLATSLSGYPFWRADQPGAMQVQNWETDAEGRGCFLNSNRSSLCYQGAVPTYAVNASTVEHVQLAVKFASEHNLRLVIKNTGHDYLGRSTGKGLSIWLHHMKKITFHTSFGCSSKLSLFPAVTFGAGVQFDELYKATLERKVTIVGGGGPSVGAAGGYSQGGGHSALSPALGLAADNMLQYEVVTADGSVRLANDCENEDLFWALRGGGGGTFGVVVSATQRTHPPLSNLAFAFLNITVKNASKSTEMLTRFTELNPSLSDFGWSGYFYPSNERMLIVYFLANRSTAFANSTLQPFLRYVRRQEGLQFAANVLLSYSSYEDWHFQVQCRGLMSCRDLPDGAVGVPTRLASRLLPKGILKKSPAELSRSLMEFAANNMTVIGHLVAGGEVSKFRNNSVNPAWRKALWHLVLSARWQDGAPGTVTQKAAKLLTESNRVLIEMTPGSGSYLNEADYDEPNWQFSFFGDNYGRLLRIKQQVDPQGLFLCRHCVGSEFWTQNLNCRRTTSDIKL